MKAARGKFLPCKTQVHQRDVFMDLTRLYKERKINNSSDFEWLKQARFYWRPGEDDAHGAGSCVISICDVDFKYRFEYLGCKVIRSRSL